MMPNKKMTTPIADFVRAYADSEIVRMHMPGHKGQTFLGCEKFDITEIYGADSLYEADGIIAESEKNAGLLFGTGMTLFSTEGSSQCIRAMLYLTVLNKKTGKRPIVVAARNVHKAFVYAAALLDIDVVWMWPEKADCKDSDINVSSQTGSICSCPVSADSVEQILVQLGDAAAAVYVTTPDYLGGQLDVAGIAEVCHKHNVILAVDNAHGAYLRFLDSSRHPVDLGADICCDSAHKTLPVLTGGAYLHISKHAPKVFMEQAKYAMGLFGSTSPSYLIMASLDLCNGYLADGYAERLRRTSNKIEVLRSSLRKAGWRVADSDPLKITVEIPSDMDGRHQKACGNESTLREMLTAKLRGCGVELEYADPDFLVFMLTPETTEQDMERLRYALGTNEIPYTVKKQASIPCTSQVLSIREAMFAESECVPLEEAAGRVCRIPTVSCPPAIPIAVPGELITEEMLDVFAYYGIHCLDVVKGV